MRLTTSSKALVVVNKINQSGVCISFVWAACIFYNLSRKVITYFLFIYHFSQRLNCFATVSYVTASLCAKIELMFGAILILRQKVIKLYTSPG